LFTVLVRVVLYASNNFRVVLCPITPYPGDAGGTPLLLTGRCDLEGGLFLVAARSELREVLLLALSVTFLLVYEISRKPLNGLRQIHREDVFGPPFRGI